MKEKQNRKIIQISTQYEHELLGTVVHALCDDGSVWTMCPSRGKWTRLPDIPGEVGE